MTVFHSAVAKRLALGLGVSALGAFSVPAASLAQGTTQDSASASASVRARTCRAEDSTTVKQSSHARIYELGGVIYGCLYSRNKRYLLAEPLDCDVADPGPFYLAGRYVAYARTFCNIDQVEDSVRVRDLKTGQELVSTAAASSLSGIGSVNLTDMVVKRNGSVAWIAKVDDQEMGAHVEVRKSDRTVRKGKRDSSKLLDTGDQIAPRSLTRSGSTISWTNAGIEKTARLK